MGLVFVTGTGTGAQPGGGAVAFARGEPHA
jgi:hypothetical protein